MKQIDEIVRSFEQCNNCGGCKGCAYEDEESCADNLEEDVLEILRKVQGGKRMKITITTPDVKDMEKQLAEEKDRAEAWELRCEELEQELRDAQDRIHEQDWTIGQYDDDNQRIKQSAERWKRCAINTDKNLTHRSDAWAASEAKVKETQEELEKAKAELDECRRDKNRLMDECTELGKRLLARPITVSLNEWAKCIHENAVAHGWWTGGVLDGDCCGILEDVDRPLPEILMLCVCELAESMEEYRDGKPLNYEGENGKPEGIAVEMVDCIIRILDWMGHNGVDVDEMIRKKHAYNIGRPYRHGGKMA